MTREEYCAKIQEAIDAYNSKQDVDTKIKELELQISDNENLEKSKVYQTYYEGEQFDFVTRPTTLSELMGKCASIWNREEEIGEAEEGFDPDQVINRLGKKEEAEEKADDEAEPVMQPEDELDEPEITVVPIRERRKRRFIK